MDEFYPGYAQTRAIMSRERGIPPVSRTQYEALRGPNGMLVVSSPEAAAEKIISISET